MTAQIILSRHGKPAWNTTRWIPGRRLGEWSGGRDGAPIESTHQPSPRLRSIAASADVLVASPLRRSLESAKLLAPETVPIVDPAFREVELPTAIHSSLDLPPQVWVKLARSAWYAGWSPGVESYAEARYRATRCTDTLEALAAEQHAVLVAGHGIMNGLIGAELRRRGWSGPRFRPRRLWAFGVFRRELR